MTHVDFDNQARLLIEFAGRKRSDPYYKSCNHYVDEKAKNLRDLRESGFVISDGMAWRILLMGLDGPEYFHFKNSFACATDETTSFLMVCRRITFLDDYFKTYNIPTGNKNRSHR